MNHTVSTPAAASSEDQQSLGSVANPRRTRVAADGTPIPVGGADAGQ